MNISPDQLPDLLKALQSIDHTSLEGTDRASRISELCKQAQFPGKGLPSTAGVCVYPIWVERAAELLADTDLQITSVVSGFPSGATFMDVRLLETELAIKAGATEVDMVISRGAMLSGQEHLVEQEIKAIKQLCENTTLKVILETGELKEEKLIREACFIAMEAGADFIKTSTGKISPAATPEASSIMLSAIAEFYQKTGKKVGFKAAGGIRTAKDSLFYIRLTREFLDDSWLTPKFFRIGASSLTTNLSNTIIQLKEGRSVSGNIKSLGDAY